MAIIMIPNIVYYIKHKNAAANTCNSKTLELTEQIGRYGCFVLMIFNIPHTYFNFWFEHALTVYLSTVGGLCLLYLVLWVALRNRNGKLRAIALSVIPSCIFLFCGIVLANIPLIAFSVLFTVSHITISYKSVNIADKGEEKQTK